MIGKILEFFRRRKQIGNTEPVMLPSFENIAPVKTSEPSSEYLSAMNTLLQIHAMLESMGDSTDENMKLLQEARRRLKEVADRTEY